MLYYIPSLTVLLLLFVFKTQFAGVPNAIFPSKSTSRGCKSEASGLVGQNRYFQPRVSVDGWKLRSSTSVSSPVMWALPICPTLMMYWR